MRSPDSRLCGKKILVTGCGGPAGVAVVRALSACGCIPIPADCDPFAAGLHMGYRGHVLAAADDARYCESLLSTAIAAGADAVVVTVAEELRCLAGSEPEFARRGIAAWFPSFDAVEACLDKLLFAEQIERAEIPAPRTSAHGPADLPGPWIVKPRRGRGSRDVYSVDDPADFPTLLRRVPDAIVQTRLSGREFTADCLVDRNGAVLATIPRWREQTRGGISTRGTTFCDDRIDTLAKDVVTALGLTGVCNIQGFLDLADPARVVEVNPRFSGGLPISLAAGADLVGQYLLALFGYPVASLSYEPGVTSVQWLDGLVVHPQ